MYVVKLFVEDASFVSPGIYNNFGTKNLRFFFQNFHLGLMSLRRGIIFEMRVRNFFE